MVRSAWRCSLRATTTKVRPRNTAGEAMTLRISRLAARCSGSVSLRMVRSIASRTSGYRNASPKQLRRLADRLVAAKDPDEVARLKKELERGFYGDRVHA